MTDGKKGELYSLSGLARKLKRAKSGLHRLAKTGQIKAFADGKYDLAQVEAALASNIDPARRRVHTTSLGEQKSVHMNASSTKPIATAEAAQEALSLIRRVLEAEGAKAGIVDFQAARTAELVLKSHERWLRLEQQSGRLVDKAAVENTVFNLSRQLRENWQNWPSRVSGEMAAELGVGQLKLSLVLDQYVRRELEAAPTPETHRQAVHETK